MHKLIMGALMAFALAVAGPAFADDPKGAPSQSVQVVKNEQPKKQSKARGYFFSTEIWVKNLSYYPVRVIAGGWDTYVGAGVTTYHEFPAPSDYSQYFTVYSMSGRILFSGYVYDGDTLTIYNI